MSEYLIKDTHYMYFTVWSVSKICTFFGRHCSHTCTVTWLENDGRNSNGTNIYL